MSNAAERIQKAKTRLLLNHPFWGALVMYMHFVEDPKVETMQTNGSVTKYNPAYVDKLSDAELEGVLAHETSHCAYLHHTRRGSRDHRLWNIAADYAINRDLLRGGFTLPEDSIKDSRFDNMSAEQIYMVVEKEEEERKEQGGQQASGYGPGNDPGGCGEVVDCAPEGQAAQMAREESEWRVRVMQAIGRENAEAQGAGNVPDHLKRMFDSLKKQPVDWREVLRRFIDDRTRQEYSWQRPNRRMLPFGLIMPGLVPDGINHIGISVDTSSSINKRALSRFVHELQAAIDEGAVSKVTVVCCDTAVKARHDYEEGDIIDFKPEGGGGTRFSPALEWFAKNEPDVSALIYFTDLDCEDFGPEPWVPTLWLAYGPANKIAERAAKVPFGEVLPLTE